MPEPIPGSAPRGEAPKPVVEKKVVPKAHPKEGPLPQETLDYKLDLMERNALEKNDTDRFLAGLKENGDLHTLPHDLSERVDKATIYVYNAEQVRQIVEGLSAKNKTNKLTEDEINDFLQYLKEEVQEAQITDPAFYFISLRDENNDLVPFLLGIVDRSKFPEQEIDEVDGDGTPPSPPGGGEPPEGPGLQPQLQTQTDSPREPPRPPTKPPSPPDGPPDEPDAAPLEKEAFRIDPALSRVLVGAVLGKAERFAPDNTTPLTSEERQQLIVAKTESLNDAFTLAESVSLDSRRSAKTDARTWFDSTKGWVERQKVKRDIQYEDRMAVFQSVGLVNHANESTVEAFYQKYFYDKSAGKAKSDVQRFVQDVAQGCQNQDGTVNMQQLEQRLTAVQGLLTAFGKEHRVDLMVRDFATSYGLLTQTAETKKRIVDEVADNITQALPRDAQERAYLTVFSKFTNKNADVKSDVIMDITTDQLSVAESTPELSYVVDRGETVKVDGKTFMVDRVEGDVVVGSLLGDNEQVRSLGTDYQEWQRAFRIPPEPPQPDLPKGAESFKEAQRVASEDHEKRKAARVLLQPYIKIQGNFLPHALINLFSHNRHVSIDQIAQLLPLPGRTITLDNGETHTITDLSLDLQNEKNNIVVLSGPSTPQTMSLDEFRKLRDKVISESTTLPDALEILPLSYDEQLRNLQQSAPELLDALLPKELGEMLPKGFSRYFLGFNQSSAITSAQEAEEHLKKYKGLTMEGYSDLNHRFKLIGPGSQETGLLAEQFAIHGYFGEFIGRFVSVFPIDDAKLTDQDPTAISQELYETYPKDDPDYPYPQDLFINGKGTAGKDDKIVNTKYIAGFIDVQGNFHRNPSFMQERL
ncbi:MAG TPA: hypothetical protein VLF20_02305 [Patescibacteria group bacterium]|nr:hypothetical protein [Patescibacteria group bacterium]